MSGTIGELLSELGLTEEMEKNASAEVDIEQELDTLLDKVFEKTAESNKGEDDSFETQRQVKVAAVANLFEDERRKELFTKLANQTFDEGTFVVRDHDFAIYSEELGESAGGNVQEQAIYGDGDPQNMY